jgi:hypothetical protein
METPRPSVNDQDFSYEAGESFQVVNFENDDELLAAANE